MNIWTKVNIINYISDPDEVNDKNYSKELQVAIKHQEKKIKRQKRWRNCFL